MSENLVHDDDFKRRVAYSLNFCSFSISQVMAYEDKFVLEHVYDQILNDLNLQNFVKDEEMINLLKRLLNTLNYFRIQAEDISIMNMTYQAKMNNAIWEAVPNLNIVLLGGDPALKAIQAATTVGVGYMNFRRNKNQYLLDHLKEKWALEKAAIQQLNGLLVEMFGVTARLSEVYGFPQVYKLSHKQVKEYSDVIMEANPIQRYNKLDVMSELFEAYPPFWYYKGNAAREVYFDENQSDDVRELFKKRAIDSYVAFDKHYIKFLNEDVVAASCALEHISLLDRFSTDYTSEVDRLLKRAVSLAGSDLDIMQMCVMVYVALNDLDSAKNLLRKLTSAKYNLGTNGVILSRIYMKNNQRTEYDLLMNQIEEPNMMPWIDDDHEACRKFEDAKENFNYVWKDPKNEPMSLAVERIVDIDSMVKKSEIAVKASVVTAGALCLIPIPFADAPMLVTAQAGMMASIATIFKINVKKDVLRNLVLSAMGVGGAALIGRAIVANLIKFIPIKGTIVGGAIAASTASVLTYALGKAFIEVCKNVRHGELLEKDLTAKMGTDMLKKHFKNYLKKSPKKGNEFKELEEKAPTDDGAFKHYVEEFKANFENAAKE